MTSRTLLRLCLFSSLGYLASAKTECTKATEKPYEIKLDANQKVASVEEQVNYRQTRYWTMCFTFMYTGSSNFEARIIIPFLETKYQLRLKITRNRTFTGLDYFPVKENYEPNKWYHICNVQAPNPKSNDPVEFYLNGESLAVANMSKTHGRPMKVKVLTVRLMGKIPEDFSFHVTDIRYYDDGKTVTMSEAEVKDIQCQKPQAREDRINWNELSWCGVKPQKTNPTVPKSCSE